MLKIGLSGGIGSGKTTVANRFEHLGLPIIDADAVAREVVAWGEPGFDQVVAEFGPQVVNPQGDVDRAVLRNLVFQDADRLKLLEHILHPLIHQQILDRIERLVAPCCIVVIPLLAESRREYPLDRVLIVDAPEPLQIERSSTRDRQSADQIAKIIQVQATRSQRLALADDIIDNSGSVSELYAQVDSLYQKYMLMSINSDA